MALSDPDSPQKLAEEILAEARRQSAEIARAAQQEAASILARATAEATQLRHEQLAQAQAEAARRTELILATVPVEAGRLRSARVEALLQSFCEELRRRLAAREGFDYRETLIGLVAEAAGAMSGQEFVLKLSPDDCACWRQDLAEPIARRAERPPASFTVMEDPTIMKGGFILQDVEGRQVWDDRFEARLERLWPELRRQIAVQVGLVGASDSAGGVT